MESCEPTCCADGRAAAAEVGGERPVEQLEGEVHGLEDKLQRYKDVVALQQSEKAAAAKAHHAEKARLQKRARAAESCVEGYRKRLAHLEATAGPTHPDALACAMDLGLTLQALGRPGEALPVRAAAPWRSSLRPAFLTLPFDSRRPRRETPRC